MRGGAGALAAGAGAVAPYYRLPAYLDEIPGIGRDVRAFPIDIDRVERAVVERFDDDDGAPVVQRVRPTEVWLDVEELRRNGHTLADVSRALMALTEADTRKRGVRLAPGHGDDPVFEAVFPSALLRRVPCLRGTGP